MQAAPAMMLYRSTIGRKVIMAVTGLIGIGFVFFHMYGNLKVFSGPVYFNEYAEGLREIGAPVFGHLHLLMVGRIVLVAAVILHVWSAISLTRQAQKARPVNYAHHDKQRTNYAALTIRWGGTVIFLFLIYHLMHFTWGTPGVHNDFIPGDAYHNLVSGFQFFPNVIVYLLAVSALGLHLYHGTWSMCQTLGITTRETEKPIRMLGLGLAIVIVVGFAVVPISVVAGIVQ